MRGVSIRAGSLQDGAKLVQKCSCASNLVYLRTLLLTRLPVELARQVSCCELERTSILDRKGKRPSVSNYYKADLLFRVQNTNATFNSLTLLRGPQHTGFRSWSLQETVKKQSVIFFDSPWMQHIWHLLHGRKKPKCRLKTLYCICFITKIC